MSLKRSIALKKRWAKVPPEQRSKQMSALAKRKQKLLTFRQKQQNAFIMVKARQLLISKKKI